jgi:hypothetical protein
LRVIALLQSRLGICRPLAGYLVQRVQELLINRHLLLVLAVFLEF